MIISLAAIKCNRYGWLAGVEARGVIKRDPHQQAESTKKQAFGSSLE